MSNYLAIATVTEALTQIIKQGLTDDGFSGIDIGSKPPDTLAGSSKNQINISLYQVTPNLGYRNIDLPTRDSNGTIVKNPQVALDLHYLISVYAAKNDEIMSQQMLASVMRAIVENPVITSNMINHIKTIPQFVDTDLDEQQEIVRFSFEVLPMDEMSKLWSSFFQTNYRISVFYKASVVLIDGKKKPLESLPVQQPIVYVEPFVNPVIEETCPTNLSWNVNPILILKGQNLAIENMAVSIGGQNIIPNQADVSQTQISVKLPNNLTSGIKQAKIIQSLILGKPGVVHSGGFESNDATFAYSPLIVDASGSTTAVKSLSVNAGDDLLLYFQPPATTDQQVSVIIGDQIISLRPPPSGGPPKVDNVTVTIPVDLPTGRYPLRLKIDGAESSLLLDTDPTSPSKGKYIIPYVEVT